MWVAREQGVSSTLEADNVGGLDADLNCLRGSVWVAGGARNSLTHAGKPRWRALGKISQTVVFRKKSQGLKSEAVLSWRARKSSGTWREREHWSFAQLRREFRLRSRCCSMLFTLGQHPRARLLEGLYVSDCVACLRIPIDINFMIISIVLWVGRSLVYLFGQQK